MKKKICLVLLLATAMAGAASAQDYVNATKYKYWISLADDTYRTLTITTRTEGYNDWGDTGIIQLVRSRLAGDPKIVEVVEVVPPTDKSYRTGTKEVMVNGKLVKRNIKPSWKEGDKPGASWKVGDKTDIYDIMENGDNVAEYRIRTPSGYFVEFAGWGIPGGKLNVVSNRRFGVILPNSNVLIAGQQAMKIVSGAVGWDDEFLAAGNLEEFMQYLAEKVDYKWLTGMVNMIKPVFDLAEQRNVKGMCPMPPPYFCGVCKGDIHEHIIMNATVGGAGWGALWGFAPPWLIPAEFAKVQAQFTAQAYLAAAIGYLHGKYPNGGKAFTEQLKIDNYILFAGKDSNSVNADGVLMNMAGSGKDAAVQEAIQEAAKFLATKLAPKFVDAIPVIGTVWGVASGAYEGAKEAQAMGRRAVKYYRGGFGDFIFDPYKGTITKYNGKDKAVKIPKLVNGKQVLIIGEKAFENNKTIESVTLEDVNTRTIKSGAFVGCSSLKDIFFPQSQTQMTIEPDVFNGTSLSEASKTKLRGFGYTGAGVGSASVKVTFNSNGGSAPNPANKAVKVGENYGAMPTVTRNGYTFNGWNTSTTGEKPVGPSSKVTATSDHTLYALWGAPSGLTVKFDASGGSTPSPAEKGISPGTAYGPLPTVTRPGYKFDGWFTEPGGGTKVEANTTNTRSSNHTLFARWISLSAITVTFNSNGGSAPNPSTRQLNVGDRIGTLPTVTRNGYTFNGWYNAPSGGGKLKPDGSDTFSGNFTTFYAQWTANASAPKSDPAPATPETKTVTFDSNGGSKPNPSTRQLTVGDRIGPLPNVNRSGYTFDGWYTPSGNKITADTAYSGSYTTANARWTANAPASQPPTPAPAPAPATPETKTVTFNSNGGSTPNPTNKQLTVGERIGPLPTVTRNGYTFDGWYTPSGNKITADTAYSGSYTTVNAQWTADAPKTITVTFNSNGGSSPSPASKQLTVGERIGPLPTVTRNGYTFDGWYTPSGNKITADTAYSGSYTTVNAQWKKQ